MRGIGKWVLLVVVVVAVVVVAREPVFWKRYVLLLAGGSASPSFSLYEPRERVAGTAEPPPPRTAPELESLDPKALEAAADYAGLRNSTALIVLRHEHIVFERYWQGTGFDTLEDGQSFARVVVALATGAALSRRQIHWTDEPIANFLPQWRADPRGAITVTQLLKMSSGLRPPEPTLNPWGRTVRAALGRDLIAADLAEPLQGRPGETWAEQSADPQLLARVIERATGMRYAEFVSQAIWRRLGAADAWLWLDRPGGNPHSDCCMLASQGDWVRVAGLLLRDGNYRGDEVMRPGWVAHMLVPAKGAEGYGSYIRLGKARPAGTEPYASDDLFLVDSAGGNRLWLIPSMGLAILRMGALAGPGANWDDATIPNLVIRGARDYKPALPQTDLSKIVPGH